MMRLETIPSWITESRWDASKLLFRIRSSQFDYGVTVGRIEASFPDSEFPVRFRSSDASHLASTLLPGGIQGVDFFLKDVRCKSAGFPNHKEPCDKEKGRHKRSHDPGPAHAGRQGVAGKPPQYGISGHEEHEHDHQSDHAGAQRGLRWAEFPEDHQVLCAAQV